MAGTTTYYGISYPTSTDYVKDGATAMQTIADGFDSAVAIPTYNNQTGTSYTFVLADAGKTVTSNNASAVTFTIPPQASVAWANNTTLTVRNLGAGVVTIAGGAGVTVTNSALTVPQYASVRIIRTASNTWTVTPAGGSSGLNLITSQTISAATTLNINNCFTSAFKNYRILITGFGSVNGQILQGRLRASGTDLTTNYNTGVDGTDFSNAGSATRWKLASTNSIHFGYISTSSSAPNFYTIDISDPQTTSFKCVNNQFTSQNSGTFNYSGYGSGVITTSSQYDGITIFSPNNITATVKIYGYGD